MQGLRRLERAILLVDIQHLISQGAGYPAAVEALVRRVLETGTPHTLWAFKFFDSTLCSLASSSRIINWAGKGATLSHYSSTDESGETLAGFRTTMEKITLSSKGGEKGGEPQVEHIANACLEALGDFSWDPLFHRDEGCSSGDSCWPESNLLLMLSSVPASGGVSSKLGALNRFFLEKRIHACWVLPPLEHDRIHEAFSDTVFRTWSFTCMDSLMLSSILLSSRLMIPFIAQPCIRDPESSRIQARLQVCIQDQLQHICRVDVKPISGEECMQLGSSKKIKLTVAAVVPRKNLSFQAREVYLLHQQESGAGIQIPEESSSLMEELVWKLGKVPASRQYELKLMILFLSSVDGAGLVNVEALDTRDNSRRCFRGVLDPFTPVSARLTIVDDAIWLRDSAERREKRFGNKVELGDRWDEAWSRCLELLQTQGSGRVQVKLPEESKCSRPLRAWNKQIRQRLKSPLLEFNRWIGRNSAEVSKEEQAGTFTGSNSQTSRQSCSVSVMKVAGDASIELASGVDVSEVREKLENEVEPEPEASSETPRLAGMNDSEPVTREEHQEQALKYISSLKEQLGSIDLRSINLQSLVAESIEALKTSEGEKWYQELKKLLLQSSRKLSSKYQSPQPSAERAKALEYAFQVKLRLEILLATQLEQDRGRFVEQMCELLSTIQFDHPGGILELEETIFESRYKLHLGEIVKEIYSRMELGGYGDTEAEITGLREGSLDDEAMEARKVNDEALQAKVEKARRKSYFFGRAKITRVKKNSSLWSQISCSSQEDEIFVAPTPVSKRELSLAEQEFVEATPLTGLTRRRPALGALDHNLMPAKRKCF